MPPGQYSFGILLKPLASAAAVGDNVATAAAAAWRSWL